MGTVNESQFRAYLEAFHETYKETVERFVPQARRAGLLRYHLMSNRIVGYLSSTKGIGFEYQSSGSGLEIRRSSRRVEHMIVSTIPRAEMLPPIFKFRRMYDATLAQFSTVRSVPVFLEDTESFCKLIEVGVEADQWRKIFHFAEIFGNRSEDYWTEARAIERAKDDVLKAILDVDTSVELGLDFGKYLDECKRKLVLVLGDYSREGKERLSRITDLVKKAGYIPKLVEDIPDVLHQSLPQKVMSIGGMARFVIVDDSSRSGHLAEMPLAQMGKWITVVLRMSHSRSSYMTHGMSEDSNLVIEREYDENTLTDILRECIEWSERTIGDREKKFTSLYPWIQTSMTS